MEDDSEIEVEKGIQHVSEKYVNNIFKRSELYARSLSCRKRSRTLLSINSRNVFKTVC